MRTVNFDSVFSYGSHIDRLSHLRAAVWPSYNPSLPSFDRVRTDGYVKGKIVDAIVLYYKEKGRKEELRVTVALRVKPGTTAVGVDVDLDDCDVFVGVEPLPGLVPVGQAVAIEIATHLPRDNPTVKHADWIVERKQLEENKRPECNEVVLADPLGNISEGLSSNFAVLDQDGSLVTAPAHLVLSGTVLELVLRLCKEMRIPVVRETPNVNEHSKWTAAFVMSTSRLATLVDSMWLNNVEIPLPRSERALLLSNQVRMEIEKASTRLL